MQKPAVLRRLESRVRNRLGLPFPWVKQALLGREVVLREHTIRAEIDYDDAWLHACTTHSEVMFDVGANVGQSALVGLLSPTIRQVVLVEANWEALALAAQNLIRNQLSSNARFVAAFAGDTSDATVDFWTVGTGAAGSMYQGHAQTAARAGSMLQVPTITLDDLCDVYQVVPDLVKIDVEGAEHKVLVGSTKLAAHKKTRFMVEMHSPPELPMAENAGLVLDWCKRVGYSAWYLKGEELLDGVAAIAHRGRCHLLLQPATWSYPEWLRGIKQSAPLP